MKIIGLTGGIAAGKNFVCDIFVKNGGVIFDADEEVHKLLDGDEDTIKAVAEKFPDSLINGKINRRALGTIALKHSNQLEVLESIIHPRVQKAYQNFLKKAEQDDKNFVILNIPLLLETNSYKSDIIVAIMSDKETRKERFLNREKAKNPGAFEENKAMLADRFENFINNQISDLERMKRSDFIIENEGSLEDLEESTQQIIDEILAA